VFVNKSASNQLPCTVPREKQMLHLSGDSGIIGH